MLPPFQTEQYSDFTDGAARAAYELALAGVAERLGYHAPLVIGSDHLTPGEPIVSVDPSQPDRVVGTASSASLSAPLSPNWAGASCCETNCAPAAVPVRMSSFLLLEIYPKTALN